MAGAAGTSRARAGAAGSPEDSRLGARGPRAHSGTSAAGARPERARGDVLPPAAPHHVLPALGVQGVVNAAVALAGLAAHQEQGVGVAVVEEGVADARPGGEGGEVALL